MMTRAEHLAWAKERALKYVELGDLQGAFLSMSSDLGKHPETQNHPGSALGTGLLMLGKLDTQEEMRKFIEGYH